MGLKASLRWLGSVYLIGLLTWVVTINLAIAPVQAAIRQLEEAPGQMVYQSRQTLKDQQGSSWQVIAFKRSRSDHTAALYLRLVGFPGTVAIDHSQPLTLTDLLGKTLTAIDVSQEMFADKTQMEPNFGEYDLQPILMQLDPAIPLQITLSTLTAPEIILTISPEVIGEWRSLTDKN